MTVSFEILMVAGIVAFYIADSAMLLYVNEYILVQHRGSLRFDFPSLRSQVAGRFLYIPNPFRPDLMLFRGAWSETNPSEQTDCPDFRVLQDRAVPLQAMTVVLLLHLLVLLPVALWLFGTGWLFLAILGQAYLVVIGMVVFLVVRRGPLNLSMLTIGKLAFDSLICVPFALNLTRKVGMRQLVRGDALAIARLVLPPESVQQFAGHIQERVDHELEILDENSSRAVSLKVYRLRLLSLQR